MSDTFPKTPGDQAPVGYKPLPGSGNSPGPDLKSLVFATAGVALGIMAGTIFADGSWRSFVPGMPHQPVLASAATAKNPTAPAPTVPPKSAKIISPESHELNQVSAAQTVPAKASAATRPSPVQPTLEAWVAPQDAPAAGTQLPVTQEKPVYRAYDPAFYAYAQRVAREQAAAKARPSTGAYFAPYVAPAPRHRAARRPRSRRASWRKAHGRHRLHAHPRAVAARFAPPPEPIEAAAVATPEGFTYRVEGSVTVTNYDPAEGRIQTYEGETFVVDKSNADSNVSAWVDYPADLHYTCNQSWNCTLVHGGVEVVSARRTR